MKEFDVARFTIPLPNDLRSAQQEILIMRQMLIERNRKLAEGWMSLQMEKRDLKDRVEQLEAKLKRVTSKTFATSVTKIINHFKGHKFHWWPTNGNDGLLAELESLKDQSV